MEADGNSGCERWYLLHFAQEIVLIQILFDIETIISPTAYGLWWNVYFHHDLPGSHKNSPIFTTATPPRSHNQNLLLCWVGWVHPRTMNTTPLVKAAIVMNEHSPSRRWRKSKPDSRPGPFCCQVPAPVLLLGCLGPILLPMLWEVRSVRITLFHLA